MAEALADGKSTFAAVTIDVAADLDVLAASVASGLQLTSYWEQPEAELAAAALGAVAIRTASNPQETFALLEALARPGTFHSEGPLPSVGPWFGGVAFDLQRPPREAWSGFPVARWVLPEVLIVRREGRVQLSAFAPLTGTPAELERALESKLLALSARLQEPARLREPAPVRRVDEDRSAWDRLIQTALSAIDGERLQKVVAARGISLDSASPFPIPTVIDRLRRASANCTTYLFRGDDGSAFVGATPELLCAVRPASIETVALGGSRIGDDPTWPADKDLREHHAIVDGITQALRPLCSELTVSPQRELRLRRLSHLQTPIQGALAAHATVADVVKALHPTPAVGGAPRARALDFLREHEGLERGWYAGAVGWIGEARADLRVALRCALIRNDQARVFVGAGIVAGSNADAEWTETATKARTALSALGVSDAA